MSNEELCAILLPLLGGSKNIISVTNCMTRLRVKLYR
jgi:phosphotransferase system IIB component